MSDFLELAYRSYVEKDSLLAIKLLRYIKERVEANREEIEKLNKELKTGINIDVIKDIIDKNINKEYQYKNVKKTLELNENYIFYTYQVPKGVLAVRCDNELDVIKNIFEAISTHNCIIIIYEKDNKYNLSNLILLIVKESLKKFDISEELVNIMESEYDYEFDNIINKNLVEKKEETVRKLYIYKYDDFFEEEVKKEKERIEKLGIDYEILTGNFEDVIDKINETRNLGASIYTQDKKIGYKFINYIHSDNVFVNTSLENVEKSDVNNNLYYDWKNIVVNKMVF